MVRRTPKPEEVEASARYTARGLDKWIEERRERGVPEEGFLPAVKFHYCDENCTQHERPN